MWGVIVDEKVVVDFAPGHVHGGVAVGHGGEEWLAIPAVQGTCQHHTQCHTDMRQTSNKRTHGTNVRDNQHECVHW